MRTTYKLTNPDVVEATLTLTMTVGEWKRLKEQLKSMSHPSWKLSDRITGMLDEAHRHFSDEWEDE